MFFWIAAGMRQLGGPQTPANHPPTTQGSPGNPPARAGAGAPVPGPPGSPSAAYLDLTRPAGSRRIGGLRAKIHENHVFFQLSRSLRHLVGFLRYREHCGAAGMYFMIKINIFNERLAAGRGWIIKNRRKSSKIMIFQISRSLRPLVGFLRFWMHCRAAGMCFNKTIYFSERLAAGRGLGG